MIQRNKDDVYVRRREKGQKRVARTDNNGNFRYWTNIAISRKNEVIYIDILH